MKKATIIFLSLVLLALPISLWANRTALTESIYLNNSFSTVQDTVGWTVSGNDWDNPSGYNWLWHNEDSYYMSCGKKRNPNASEIYTLTSPQIILGASGADFSLDYAKVETGSTFIVYVLSQGVRHVLIPNLAPTGSADIWSSAEASLSAYAGDTIHLVFEHTTIAGYVYLDNLKMEEPPLCPTAKNITLSALGTTSASFTWNNATSDQYDLLLTSEPQLDPNSPIASEILLQKSISATANGTSGWTYTENNLTENTIYNLYLKSNCTATMHGESTWSHAFNFQTPCASTEPVPYTMNFDSLALGAIPPCWLSSSSYETLPQVIAPLSGDLTNTTKVFSLTNNVNSETMIVLPLFASDIKTLMLNLDAKSDLDSTTFQIGLTNDLTDAQSIVMMFQQSISNEWGNYTFFFENSFSTLGSNYYIVIYIAPGKTESINAFHIYLDNISVDQAPSCLYPLQLSVRDILENGCTLSWLDKSLTSTGYTIEYTPEGGSPQTVTTTENPYQLTGLIPNTKYSVRVLNHCSATDQSAYSTPQSFLTLRGPIVVSTETAGSEDFEQSGHAFTILGSETPNIWAVGTALAHSPSHAMYISGDLGVTYGTVDASSYSYAYAYAKVNLLTAGNYTISFSWKGLSNSDNYSHMYVFLTPEDKTITLNDGWDDDEPGTTLIGDKFTSSTNEAWESVSYTVNAPSAGLYHLVFYRKTSRSSKYIGNYTAVDDIRIEYISCDAPTDFTQSSMTTNSIGLSWMSSANNFTLKGFTNPVALDSIDSTPALSTTTSSTTSVNVTGLSPATVYYFYVKAQCDSVHQSTWVGPLLAMTDCALKDLPFSTDFNHEVDGSMPLCWVGTPIETYVTNDPSSHFDMNDTPVLALDGGSLDYAILPEFNTPINQSVLEFDYISRSASRSGQIIVGYVTNPSDFTTFVGLDTLEPSTSMTHVQKTYTEVNDSMTGRLAIAQTAGRSTSSHYGGSLDNIEVYQLPTCWPIDSFNHASLQTTSGFTLSWNPSPHSSSRNFTVEYGVSGFVPGSSDGTIIQTTDTFCTITGLEVRTLYDVYVSTNCGASDGTSTSVMGSFETLSLPADGTNYSCNFEDSIENANWIIARTSGLNAWEIGTQSYYEGNKGLYLVDVTGQLGYDDPEDHSWAFRHLHCTAGLYTVSFEYKCEGEDDYDYMNCVVIPETYVPSAGNAEGITETSIPEGWFTGVPIQMNEQDDWTSYTFEFTVASEKDVTLAFHWYNDDSSNNDPPSVDQITVSRINCLPVSSLSLDSLAQTTAHLVWNSEAFHHFEVIVDDAMHSPEELDTLTSATSINRNVLNKYISIQGLTTGTPYYAYVRHCCSETQRSEWSEGYSFTTLCTQGKLPFTDNFETTALNNTPLCWTWFTGDNVRVNSDAAFSLNQSLWLQTAEASSIKLALPMVHMPLAIENYQLVFYALRPLSTLDNDFSIAINASEEACSNDLNSVTSTPITLTKTQEGTWQRIVVPFEHPTDLVTGQPVTMGEDQNIFITIPGPAALYIDAVKIEAIPSCAEPYNSSIDSVLEHQVFFSWDGVSTQYEARCISANTLDTLQHIVLGDSAIFSGLSPHTPYYFSVRSICSSTDTSAWSQPKQFRTLTINGSIPYSCNFEPTDLETSAWTFQNDSVNQWRIDTAGHLSGNHSLYISNDQAHATYDNSIEQYSYAVRTIHFERGSYTLSFSWQCEGESDYDYMMVGLTPATFMPQAGDEDFNGEDLDEDMNAPTNSMIWGQFSDNSITQSALSSFSIATACDMNLIFAWTNDDSAGSNPSIIIDDVSITSKSCGIPFDIHTEALTANYAQLVWINPTPNKTHLTVYESGLTGALLDTTVTDTTFMVTGLTANTSYTAEMYSICSATDTSAISDAFGFTTPCVSYTLPFNESFDTDISTPLCWKEANNLANLQGSTNSSTLEFSNSSWRHHTTSHDPSANTVLNLYGEDHYEWLITPLIAMTEHPAILSFDVALTNYDDWTSPENESGVDDKFAVLISRDYGNTWQVLSLWEDSSAVGHRYYDIPNTYQKEIFEIPSRPDLAPIQIAFYGQSTESNGDNDIHLDNIHINCIDRDTSVIYDSICEGYAYTNYGFSIPADMVITSSTYTQSIIGDSAACDQVKELHLEVHPRYDQTQEVTICKGQSFPFGVANLTESGEYINTLSSVNGCDSVIHLNLTVTPLLATIDTTICEGESITLGDKQITQAGLYTDTTINTEGCDSITHLTLSVLPRTITLDTTICEGDVITVGSKRYTSEGTYIDTLQNSLNCDSIITLYLTVIPTDTLYNDQFCANSSYNFRGSILTEAGIYTDTVHNYLNSNCDHIYTLNLSVTLPDTVEISDQFCEDLSSYNEYGFSIDDPEEKDYTMTKTSSVTGCDSVTILHLSQIMSVYDTISQTICDNESYTFGGKDYYTPGTYDHTFTSEATGCDSLVTLYLTVNPSYTVDVNDTITTKQLPYTNLTLVVPVGTEVGKYDYTIESATQAGCDSTIYLTLTITKGDGLANVNVSTLNFYPTVVKGGEAVTITTDFSASERQEMSIRLYDATGKLMATYQPQTTGLMSYIMPEVSGLYFLRLETEDGQTYSGKIIVL